MLDAPSSMPDVGAERRSRDCGIGVPPVKPRGRLLRRSIGIVTGILLLTSPLLLPAVLWRICPVSLEVLFEKYTGLTHDYVRTSLRTGEPLSPKMERFVPRFYLQRALVETLVRVYNHLAAGLLLTAAAVACWGMLQMLASRADRDRRRLILFAGCALFIALYGSAAAALRTPAAPLLAAAVTAVYVANFRAAPFVCGPLRWEKSRWGLTAGLLATPGASHIFVPTAVFATAATLLRPDSKRTQAAALALGQFVVCLLTVPALNLAFLSNRLVPRSDRVTFLSRKTDLYGIGIDTVGNRLIVSRKLGGKGAAIDPADPGNTRAFTIPSSEFEDLALDPGRRELYHVDRDTQTALVVNLDSFEVVRRRKIPVEAKGSTRILCLASSNALFVRWEGGGQAILDRDTLELRAFTDLGRTDELAADVQNGVVFLKPNHREWVAALDAATLRVRSKVPFRLGWLLGMTFSESRAELYVGDPLRSRVFVYSSPELAHRRTLKAGFGVRGLAVDDSRSLLLAISFISGYLDVIDLNTGKTRARHYVGPYSRAIRLYPQHRYAFVTLRRAGLALVRY